MKGKIKVGIVGCGWAGEQHVKAYSSLPEVEIIAVADINEGKAKELTNKWSASAYYRDYRRILADPRIDAVSICLPHYLHSQVAVR